MFGSLVKPIQVACSFACLVAVLASQTSLYTLFSVLIANLTVRWPNCDACCAWGFCRFRFVLEISRVLLLAPACFALKVFRAEGFKGLQPHPLRLAPLAFLGLPLVFPWSFPWFSA